MFLSKVLLSGAAAHQPYEWHRALWSLFPERPEAERRFLFRVERRGSGGAECLVQSAWAPETSVRAAVLASKPWRPELRMEQRLRFRLCVNPVRTIRDAEGRQDQRGMIKSCRVPLIDEDEQFDWLTRKLATAAHLESSQLSAREELYFRRKGEAGKLVQLRFEGVLRVAAPDALRGLIESGIGPAKAFGCGLLSLAPA